MNEKKNGRVKIKFRWREEDICTQKNMTFNKFSCVFLHIKHYDKMMGKKNGYSVQYR